MCESCYLVQLDEYVSADHIFTEYAYFSSYADSWVEHAKRYVDFVTDRFGLNRSSFVVELASNDGYLLKHFLPKGIPVLGIEPAANVAKVAVDLGVHTLVKFFGVETAKELAAEGRHADLIAGNNVLAQVPGRERLRRRDPDSAEAGRRRDDRVPASHAVDRGEPVRHDLPRAFLVLLVCYGREDLRGARHAAVRRGGDPDARRVAPDLRLPHEREARAHGARARELKAREIAAGMMGPEYYRTFTRQVEETKWRLLEFLIEQRRKGKRIAGYGAPGKGNTLLNYCGIRTDLLEFTVDRNVYKQGKFLPGTHIPILIPDAIREARPDFVLILPVELQG